MILKRLIAISVVLALAAGAVFAEISVSGQVIGTVNILESNSEKGAKKGPDGKEFDADGNWLGTEGKPLSASATLNRIRLDASGETDDGKFGAWIRADAGGVGTGQGASFYGNAWWKPIDQLLIRIGSNGYDGFFGKDGVTRWGFYQTVTDTGVTFGGDNAWGDGFAAARVPEKDNIYGLGLNFSSAFFGGNGNNAFRVSISPLEIIDINLEVPFFDGVAYDPDKNPKGLASSIFRQTLAQVDVKLDAANIALTYAGGLGYRRGIDEKKGKDWWFYDDNGTPKMTNNKGDFDTDGDGEPDFDEFDIYANGTFGGKAEVLPLINPGKFYLYGGIPVGDSLSIDIGLGFTLPVKEKGTTDENGDTEIQSWSYLPPIAAGLGVKFATGSFGIKARVVASFAGSLKMGEEKYGTTTIEYDKVSADPLRLLFDVLPYYSVSDNLTIFLSAGLGITGKVDKEYKMRSGGVEADWIKDEYDAVVGWHINPYVQIGQEWGPKFLAGVKIWSKGEKYKSSYDKNWTAPAASTWTGDYNREKPDEYGYKKVINWAIPIALNVSF